jgi:four helix bundle protein
MQTENKFNEQMKKRTFDTSMRVVKVVQSLPNNTLGWKIGDQLIRSGTAIGALTEEAYMGVSYKDFIHGFRMARKETTETRYWLKIVIGAKLISEKRLSSLIEEISEIIAIQTSSIKKGESKIYNKP